MNMLENKKYGTPIIGDPMKKQMPESESVNPDQRMEDASKELIKAIDKKDPARVARVFMAMMKVCMDDMETESEQEDMTDTNEP